MGLRKRSFWFCPFVFAICIAAVFFLPIASPGEASQVTSDQPGKFLKSIKVGTKKDFPIIFLPGVAGTRLYKKYRDANREIWPLPLADDKHLIKMSMDVSGLPLDKNIVPGDIIRSVLPKFHNQLLHLPIYGPFLESIQFREFGIDGKTWSYKEGKNLFVWGYDWRLDNSDHLVALDKFINQVRVQTRSEKVILIAHSMGGLISRAYAVRNADKVETIISIGSPFAGSPKPFYALVMGYTFGNKLFNTPYMKELVQNSPSTYQLLPQYDFVSDSREADGKKIPNQDLYNKMKYKDISSGGLFSVGNNSWSMNKKLIDRAQSFYEFFGTAFNPVALPSNVKHYAIIGVGVKTLEGFNLKQASPTDKLYLDYDGQKVILAPFFGDGDGTVPLKSANLNGTTRTYFIQHGEGFNSSGVHGELPNNWDVQNIVRSILIGYPFRITGSPDSDKRSVDIEPETDFTLK
jgi:hypothetical protein